MSHPPHDRDVSQAQQPTARPPHLDDAIPAELQTTATVTRAHPRRQPRWRGALATAMIVLAGLVTPLAMLGTWAKVTLTDTDAFVATYAPVIRDPAMQAYLTDQVSGAIVQQLKVEQLVGDAVAALQSTVGDRPRAAAAIGLLQQPAIDGIRDAITRASARVIAADTTAGAWREALRLSHSQAIGALSGDPATLTAITDQGLGLRIGPIVERVKTTLIDQGWTLAARIPAVDRTIIVVPSSDLQQVQQYYRLVVGLGAWLPWLVVGLMVGGVLIANNRVRAIAGSGLAVALGAGAVVLGLGLTRRLLPTQVPASAMPSEVLQLLVATVTTDLSDVADALFTLGVVVALLGWWSGGGRTAQRLRAAWTTLATRIRRGRDALGLTTGRFGRWLFAARVWLRALVVAAAIAFLAANRPLSPGLILATAGVSVALLLVAALLSPAESPTAAQSQPAPAA